MNKLAWVCLWSIGVLMWLGGCAAAQPAPLPSHTAAATPLAVSSPSPTPLPSQTATPTEAAPLILVFYGDSQLKIGEVGRQGQSGASFVDWLPEYLPAEGQYSLIFANYGGRKARWAAEHIEEKVLVHAPDIVTLWWGMNDLDGCPGIFDQNNRLLDYKLEYYVEEHRRGMQAQIDSLLAHEVNVFVVSSMPVLGGNLPWSHRGPNGEVVWEEGRWCPYNRGLERLVAVQRELASAYAAAGEAVFLVDVWALYEEHALTERMYMDVMHPGTQGADLIAQAWAAVFAGSGIR